jgi:hypothetical protein
MAHIGQRILGKTVLVDLSPPGPFDLRRMDVRVLLA